MSVSVSEKILGVVSDLLSMPGHLSILTCTKLQNSSENSFQQEFDTLNYYNIFWKNLIDSLVLDGQPLQT